MLGKNVAYLRKKKGLNNYRFSLLTGVDNAGIIRIENGQSKDPALSTVIKLAKVFNISLDELVFEDLEAKEQGGNSATL